jgi:uroporphyrinogen-III synthase
MSKTLKGLRILNTRPKEQAQALSKKIKEAGGIPIEFPTIEIQASNNTWTDSLSNLNTISQAIFVSPNAVRYFFNELKKRKITWPDYIHVIAIGKGTASALEQFNIAAHDTPDLPDSEHLLNLKSLQQIRNQSLLLVKGEGGRKVIEEYLLLKGAKIIILQVYKRVAPSISTELINTLWREDKVDIILLTSEQSIHNLFNMFNKEGQTWLQNKPCLVISERLAQSAAALGFKNIMISHPERMIGTLFDYKD